MKREFLHHRNDDRPRCRECGEPLVVQACDECNASGMRRSLLSLTRPCDVCDGVGKIIRCPDASEHIGARIRSLLSQSPTSPSADAPRWGTPRTSGARPIGSQQCRVCGGTGAVTRMARIPNPTKYMRFIPGYQTIPVQKSATCGSCDGKGWLPPKREPR